MIFIIGTKERTKVDATSEETDEFCHTCGYFSKFQRGVTRNWLTLFFIPIFPFGDKTPVNICTRCGSMQH